MLGRSSPGTLARGVGLFLAFSGAGWWGCSGPVGSSRLEASAAHCQGSMGEVRKLGTPHRFLMS